MTFEEYRMFKEALAEIGGNNVVFKICGNNYRLWVLVAFKSKNVMILKIGTHSEYDRWDIK
jgi:mRNA interferase HigB